MTQKQNITITDMTDVIYTAARVFDNLRCTRQATAQFLDTGSTVGITSRADLSLLQDLRDAAAFVIEQPTAVLDAQYLSTINSNLTRSGPLHPGRLRTDDQHIGVSTVYGRHEPTALNLEQLDALCHSKYTSRQISEATPADQAITMFISLARAQPFEDGNKRTALLAANSILLATDAPYLLTAPVEENDPSVTRNFTQHLARFYVFGEHESVMNDLQRHGLLHRRDINISS